LDVQRFDSSVGIDNNVKQQTTIIMKASKIKTFLSRIEKELKHNNRTLDDVNVNFRFNDDSDVHKIKCVEEDLFDSTTNTIVESIIFKIK